MCKASTFIFFLGATVWGGTFHDMALLENEFKNGIDWFDCFELWADMAYLGFENKFRAKKIHRPKRKPRKSKNNPNPSPTEEQKLNNHKISKERVVVEHAIRGMKRYNILVFPLRARCEKFIERVIGVCAGLWNFKLSFQLA